MANTFDVKTMNGSRVTENTAGIESIANTRSAASTLSSTMKSGVVNQRRPRNTTKRSPWNRFATGITRRMRRTIGFLSG